MADTLPHMQKARSVELVHDNAWKKIQQNTFTRWTNQHLKTVGMEVINLVGGRSHPTYRLCHVHCVQETDLSDGIKLIKLAEVLAGRQLPRFNRNPALRTQKLDNISLALKFFQDDEGIRLVNIGHMR